MQGWMDASKPRLTWKHSQYFLRHLLFLQAQPLLWDDPLASDRSLGANALASRCITLARAART